MPIVQAEANRLLDASFGVTAYVAPTGPMRLALTTNVGTATTAGTEVTGGSYTRQSLTMGAATAGANANTGTVSFTNMPATTVQGVDIYDSAGSPRRAWTGGLTTNRTTGAGDTLSFPAASITSAIT